MTQNQKILIGVGLLGLGYLLWKNSKKSTQVADSGNGTTDSGNGLSESLPTTIKDGAVINGKKYSISSQADCPDGYRFGDALPEPCTPGRICDSGGPRCVRLTPVTPIKSNDIFSKGCPGDLAPCPDDSGCFDPSKNPISDWEAGRPHPCNRLVLKDTRPLKNWS